MDVKIGKPSKKNKKKSNTIRALVFIRFKSEEFSEFIQHCHRTPQIKQCYRLTGEYDALLEVEVESFDLLFDFYRFMNKFAGLQAMNTHMVLREWNL